MNSQKIAKLIICVIVAGALVAYCDKTWAQGEYKPRSRYTPPPIALPPPRPPQQLWPKTSFYTWVSKDVIKEFKSNGLEVEDIKPAYILGPVLAREGMIFLMPSYGADIGGYVSSYNTEDDIEEMRAYYLEMNKDPESPAWWIYEKDNILLLISGKIPKAMAEEYGKALNEIGKPH